MYVFHLVFVAAVSGAHAYLFWSLQRIFDAGAWPYYSLAAIVLFIAAMVYRRQLLRFRLTSFVVAVFHLWMGYLLMTTLALMARDFLEICAWALDRTGGSPVGQFLASPESVAAAMVIGALLFGYALREAQTIQLRGAALRTDKLPADLERLRIVVLADLHLTPYTKGETIAGIVALANAQNPDMIVLLGDLVDGRFRPDGEEAALLSRLRARFGVYAVVGNHEFLAGLEDAVRFIEGAGLTLLRGSVAEAGGICVAGVDDPASRRRLGFDDVLRQADPDKFVLVLSHRPEVPAETVGRFDLWLSGHTHGGQVWPGGVLMRILYRLGQGMTALAAPEGRPRRLSHVYVTNGARYYGPPVRFFAPPEIAVIELNKKN